MGAVSQPQPLQDRVLSVLLEQGPVRAKDLGQWLPGIDRGGLDCAVNALMRTNKVSLTLGTYDLVRAAGGKDVVYQKQPPKPPSASEGAVASLAPAVPTQVCIDCHQALPLEKEFQLTGHGQGHSKICRRCMGKRARNGRELERSEGNPVLPVHSKLGSTASPNENPPSNTATEASVVSPQTSHDTQPLAAADPATGRTINGESGMMPTDVPVSTAVQPDGAKLSPTLAAKLDPVECALLHKRAWLVQKRDQLLREYEANLMGVLEKIEEIDGVLEQVRRLCGDP